MHITDYEKVKDLVWNNLFLLDGGDEIGTKTIFAGDLGKALFGLMDSNDMINTLDIMGADGTDRLKGTDKILVGTSDGNKALALSSGLFTILDAAISVDMRKNIFRGKNLGSVITDKQWNEIKNGTFRDMFIGDYWVINDIHWRIADINYWWGMGDTISISTPHLLILPDENLGNAQINTTNTTEGGYAGSRLYKDPTTNGTDVVKGIFTEDHLLKYREWVSNSVDGGLVVAGVWVDAMVLLPTESMVFGTRCFSSMTSQNASISLLHTVSTNQAALFRLSNQFTNPHRYWYWFRDVCSSACFVRSDSDGSIGYRYASYPGGVRPIFGLVA